MGTLNLNTATVAQLMVALHGIGIGRAKAIVAARPFKSPAELVQRGVLTMQVYERIAHRLSAEAVEVESSNQ